MEEIIHFLQKTYAIDPNAEVEFLRESPDNIVYLVKGDPKRIIRISKRELNDDLLFEINAINALIQDGFSVASVVKNQDEELYTVLPDGATAVLFEFVEGSHIDFEVDKKPSDLTVFEAGKELGIFHNISRKLILDFKRSRNIFTELERVEKVKVVLRKYKGGEEFLSLVNENIDFANQYNEEIYLIHNDYRPHNVLFRSNDKISAVLDFDWSCKGPIIKDFALGLVEWSFPDSAYEPWQDLLDAFLEGYNSVADISVVKNESLNRWICFACLSETATYLCDSIIEGDIDEEISSYMYRKYKYFARSVTKL
jgi:Ser/Thr protein kinase RdoA (MazF antagonist)